MEPTPAIAQEVSNEATNAATHAAKNEATGAWTDARIALMREYWDAGLTASQIAKKLGGVSRSAVLGKVRRLGFPARVPRRRADIDQRPKTRAARRRAANRERLAVSPAAAAPFADADVPLAQRRTFDQLTPDACRWPIGEVGAADFAFCGGASVAGKSYCARHLRRAYQPDTARRPSRRAA
jgi:GcrA cell cycle regulator